METLVAVGERVIAFADPYATDTARRPVVLVHGSSFGRGTWAPCLEWLGESGRYRPIAIDMPGHGESSGPVCHSAEDLGRVLAGFVDALRLDRFALLGHSLGGAVAQWYQRRFPLRVAALGLVSTSPKFSVPADVIAQWKLEGTEYPPERIAGIVAPSASHDLRRELIAIRTRTTPEALESDLDAVAAWNNLDGWLSIDAPTLVVTATHDAPAIKQYAHEWAAALPLARLVVIDDAGHMMTNERPAETSAAIVEWLDRVWT